MNQDPATKRLHFTPLERGAAAGLPAAIDVSEAFDKYNEVLAMQDDLNYRVQRAQMSPFMSEKGSVPSLAKNVAILGRTAAELFGYALANWPITTKHPDN